MELKNLDTEIRLKKEAEFHDNSFTSDLRQRANKYYTIIIECRNDYNRLISEKIKGKNVLEYGCGTGSHGFELAKLGANVHGIDISPVAIELAIETAVEHGVSNNTHFCVMNAEELKYEDNTFDLICGTGIIHHLDLEKSFAEINRVLKKGGKAVFSEPLGHNPVINWYRKRTPEMRTEDEHPLLFQDLALAKKYFSKIEFELYGLSTFISVPFRNTPIYKPLYWITEQLDKLLLHKYSPIKKWAWHANIQLTK